MTLYRKISTPSGWLPVDLQQRERLWQILDLMQKWTPSKLSWACSLPLLPLRSIQILSRSLLKNTWLQGLPEREIHVNWDRKFWNPTPMWKISIYWNQKWILSVPGNLCPSMESASLWWGSMERRRTSCLASVPTGSWGWPFLRETIWRHGDTPPWRPGMSTGRPVIWWFSLKMTKMSFSRYIDLNALSH